MHLSRRGLLGAAALPLVCPTLARGQGAQPFFKDKTLRVLVGTTPGAGYDMMARLVASHLERKVPGNPRVVVENMPGAASLTMMNHLYTRSARDGTAIGLPLNGVVLEPTLKLLSRSGGNVQFDIERMHWLGTPSEEPQVLWYRADSKIKSIDDMRSIKSVVGASSTGADNYIVARLTNALLGGKLDIITGYAGTAEVFLAGDRGEVEGSCTAYSAITASRPRWLAEKKVRILLQYGAERLPELPDVPTAIEIAPDEDTRAMLRFYAVKFKTAYPFVLPPEVPADRIAILRAAFDEIMRDADFARDVAKANMALRPLNGAATTELIRSTYAVPAATVDKLRAILIPERSGK